MWTTLLRTLARCPCPLSFTDDDKSAHDEQYVLWTQSIELMTDFLTSIGGYRGWDDSVSHEQYHAGKEHMERFEEDFIARHSSTESEKIRWLDVWPLPDQGHEIATTTMTSLRLSPLLGVTLGPPWLSRRYCNMSSTLDLSAATTPLSQLRISGTAWKVQGSAVIAADL